MDSSGICLKQRVVKPLLFPLFPFVGFIRQLPREA